MSKFEISWVGNVGIRRLIESTEYSLRFVYIRKLSIIIYSEKQLVWTKKKRRLMYIQRH